MKKNSIHTACLALATALCFTCFSDAFAQPANGGTRVVDLPVSRTGNERRYVINVDISVDGGPAKSSEKAAYAFGLHCAPNGKQTTPESAQLVTYRCTRFSILEDGKETATIPAMSDFTYKFAYPASEIAPEGNVFGLPYVRFSGLLDSKGKPLGPQNDFLVYNAFTDYHVLCNVYAQRTLSGGGVQELRRVGDEVTHVTSRTRTPLDDVPGLQDGSEFVHGRVVLKLEGVEVVERQKCAVVGFRATDNRIKTIVEPFDGFKVISEGTSKHDGKLWISLSSGWVLKASMRESVNTRLDLNGKKAGPIVTIRNLTLREKRN